VSIEPGVYVSPDGALSLRVPSAALDAPIELEAQRLAVPPRGAVAAWELGPDGTQFAEAVALEVSLAELTLPAGVDAAGLYLAVLEQGRWQRLEQGYNDGQRVAAELKHFSTYGVVASPADVAHHGTRWEANGIVATASAPAFARLFVSPTAIGFYVSAAGVSELNVGFSGLPTDEPNYLYLDSHDELRLLTPADGGVLSLQLDGTREHYLWMQPQPGTLRLGDAPGISDECPSVGVREGNTCRLTQDVEGELQFVAPGQVLDCDGHRISQHFQARGTGIGVLIHQDQTTLRNCVLGGEDAGYWQAVVSYGCEGTRVEECQLEGSAVGVSLLSTVGPEVLSSELSVENLGIEVWGTGATEARLSGNRIFLGSRAVGIELRGFDSPNGAQLVSQTQLTWNEISAVSASTAVSMSWANEVELSQNRFHSVQTGVLIGEGTTGLSLWWNDVESSDYGVWSSSGPLELSQAGRGNWWGRACPGPLFEAGVDSNRTDVLDSYAYGMASGWELGWTPGCDETAPEPPVVEAPGDGARLLTAHPVFLGTAEALSTVRLYEDGVELGATQADRSGRFVMAAALPLLSGVHTVTATATDVQGNTSLPSAPRSFETAQLSELENSEPQDKLRVLSFELGPNPFDPRTELNRLTVELEVDGVKGLGGNSPKHRFVAMMRRTMRDAQTGAVVATVYASTELDNGLSLQGFELSDGWDGRDELGELVEPNRAYSLEVEVMVARFWTGIGNGPGCGPEDLQEALRIGASPGVFERISALPACCVSVRPLVRTVLNWMLSQVVALPPWNPSTHAARNCAEAAEACKLSSLEQKVDPNNADGKDQCDICQSGCLMACSSSIKDCAWPVPTAINARSCRYWDAAYGEIPAPIGSPVGTFATKANRKPCSPWPASALGEPNVLNECTYLCDTSYCLRHSTADERASKACYGLGSSLDQSQMLNCDGCIWFADGRPIPVGGPPEADKQCEYSCASAMCVRDAWLPEKLRETGQVPNRQEIEGTMCSCRVGKSLVMPIGQRETKDVRRRL
jgi:hypothetical protein